MGVVVSDHALLRWLERHHGISLEDVRKELADKVKPFYDVKAKHFPIDDVWIVMDGPFVRTVLSHKPDRERYPVHDRGKAHTIESPFEGKVDRMLKRRHG